MKKNKIYKPLFAGIIFVYLILLGNVSLILADQITGTRVNPDTNQWESTNAELATYTYELSSDNAVLRQYLIGAQSWSSVERYRYEFYADFTNADTFQYIDFMSRSMRCCSNPDQINAQLQVVSIKNRMYTYSNIAWYSEGDPYCSGPVEDISHENWGSEKVTVDIYSPKTTCRNCEKQITRVTSLPGKIYIKDMRGSAKLTNVTANFGEAVTITPEYNQYADHVTWGIRYPGESSYTLLSDGQQANGMVVSGANEKTLTLSNYPPVSGNISLALHVYDRNNQLPIGTTYPSTKFTMNITGYDKTGPIVNLTKEPNPSKGTIVVKIEASDAGGLAAKPYSFDGGVTYGNAATKEYSAPGKITVAVKDASGNVTLKEIVIDAIDIQKLNPGKPDESDTNINKPETGTASGSGTSGGLNGSGSSNSGGGNVPTGNQNGGATGNNGGDSNLDQYKKPTDSFDDIKNTGNTDSVQNAVITGTGQEGVKNPNLQETSKGTLNDGGKGQGASSKDINEKINSKVTPISKEKADSLFDKIKNNSEEYLKEEEVDVTPDGKLSGAGTGEIRLGKLEKDSDKFDEFAESSNEYVDEEIDDVEPVYVKTDKTNHMAMLIGIIILIISLILILLMFILFFGVLIFAEKEDELSKLSSEFRVKTLKAIRFVTLHEKQWAVNFGELLSKNDTLEAHFGLLFTYLYEGEKLKILTKFKGEKPKVIATEKIAKIVLVGRKRVKL